MIVKKSHYPKFITLAVLLSITNLGLNCSKTVAEVNNKNKIHQASEVERKSSRINQVIKSRGRLIANFFGGIASWYGPGFDGRTTANGETYNQNALTAAHRYLSFGTRVKVTNLNNGRSVVVRINDRGPFSGGRVIDLSAAAANSLNMIHSGVAPVKVTVLGQ